MNQVFPFNLPMAQGGLRRIPFALRRGGVRASLAQMFGVGLVADYKLTVSKLWEAHLAAVAAGGLPLLYQDTGVTPVTALGQVVGCVFDTAQPVLKQTPAFTLVKNSGDGVVTVSGNLITITGATTTTRVDVVGRVMRPGVTGIRSTYTGGAASPLLYVAGVPDSLVSGVSKLLVQNSMNGGADRFQISSGSATFLLEEFYEVLGNHLGQTSSTGRPVLTSRVNLLLHTENFADAVWTKTGMTATAGRVTPSTASSAHRVAQAFTISGIATFTSMFRVKADGYNKVAIVDSHHSATSSRAVDLRDGSTASLDNTGGTTTVVAVGDGWYDVTWTQSAYPVGGTSYSTSLTVLPDTGVTNSFGGAWVGNGTSGVLVARADIRIAAHTAPGFPAYQRVGVATDFDVVGFPVGLVFDGINDSLDAYGINLSAVTEVDVFCLAHRRAGTGRGTLLDFVDPISNPNGFALEFSTDTAAVNAGVRFRSNGAAQASSVLLPLSTNAVLHGRWAGADQKSRFRLSGGTESVSVGDTGNVGGLGTGMLRIGARVGGTGHVACTVFTLPIIIKRTGTPEEITTLLGLMNSPVGVLP